MSKPDDIPQDIWDTVIGLDIVGSGWKDYGDDEVIARAILAERERCAAIAASGIERKGDDPWVRGYRCGAADIAAAIAP